MFVKCTNTLRLVMLFANLYPVTVFAQTQVTNIQHFDSRCDYLIVAPEDFLDCALRLAYHRNAFEGDDVAYAKVVTMELIVREFDPTGIHGPRQALWEALHFAWHHWQDSLTYVVFLGDDKPDCCTAEGTVSSIGRVPTFAAANIYERVNDSLGNARKDTLYEFSDAWFLSIDGDSARLPKGHNQKNLAELALGRIPCENLDQCSSYVNKVIYFDLQAPDGPWRNRVLAFADDFYQSMQRDPILPPHYKNAEITIKAMGGRWTTRVYSGEFSKDDGGFHSNARDAFFREANKGNLWNIYFGHGHSNLLSEEHFVTGADWRRFTNHSTPGVFLSMCCMNGAFYRDFDSAMCKQFLFAPNGGAIVYIASATIAYAYPSQRLATSICSYHDQNPELSIGRLFLHVEMTDPQLRSNNMGYYLLGDPALRPARRRVAARLEAVGDGMRCSFPEQPYHGGAYRYTWSVPDTVHFPEPDNDQFYIRDSIIAEQKGSFSNAIDIAPSPQQRSRLIVYAWGESFEGRLDTVLNAYSINAKDNGGIKALDGWAIAVKGGTITISSPGRGGQAKLALFDMRGRMIRERAVNLTSGKCTILIRNLDVAPGRLIARLSSPSKVLTESLLFIR
ncbi:MAG: hypothetical protein GF344_15665 [Chitinivibrionales bacterium]|nr:hypothetical protein [Chitinivibrionales bacterium]MBD3358138.1 hypothetical protein [Chitinivibrionales bacterium]